MVAFSLAPAVAADREPQASSLKLSVNCGPNAVFMFLVLCGANPTEESVDSIVCGADGTSLAELMKFAESYGVHTEVRRYAPVDYQRMRLPAICQTRGGPDNKLIKHFLVAYEVDPTGIWTLDGTTGKRFRIRRERIDSYLSGYALVRKSSVLSVSSGTLIWLAILLLVFNALLLYDLLNKRIRAAAHVSDRDGTSAESES